MNKNFKNLSLKIDPELLKKFRYVARYDDRSMNWYLNKMIANCVAKFEAKHGAIEFEDEENP
jgi:predicted transcriptional regulator